MAGPPSQTLSTILDGATELPQQPRVEREPGQLVDPEPDPLAELVQRAPGRFT
jgi:hypothetical protein